MYLFVCFKFPPHEQVCISLVMNICLMRVNDILLACLTIFFLFKFYFDFGLISDTRIDRQGHVSFFTESSNCKFDGHMNDLYIQCKLGFYIYFLRFLFPRWFFVKFPCVFNDVVSATASFVYKTKSSSGLPETWFIRSHFLCFLKCNSARKTHFTNFARNLNVLISKFIISMDIFFYLQMWNFSHSFFKMKIRK